MYILVFQVRPNQHVFFSAFFLSGSSSSSSSSCCNSSVDSLFSEVFCVRESVMGVIFKKTLVVINVMPGTEILCCFFFVVKFFWFSFFTGIILLFLNNIYS